MATGRGRDPRSRAHAALRRFLPADFSDRHGEAMEVVFRERLEAERRRNGVPGLVAAWVREALDLAGTGVRLRMESRKGRGGNMSRLLDDLRGAGRSLRRSPGFAAFAVGTLALGIGSAVTFASFLDRLILRPVDFPQADRLVMVWRNSGGRAGMMVSPDRETRERVGRSDVFDGVAAMGGKEVAWSTGEGPVVLDALLVDEGLPTLAALPPILGRFFDAADLVGEGAAVVVLSESLWRREFGGDPSVIGSTLRIEGAPHTVVGVAPQALRAPLPGAHVGSLWLPLAREAEVRGLNVLARLRDGVTLAQARERMEALDLAAAEAERSPWATRLLPVAEMVGTRLKNPLKVAGAAVALLLLIACMNVANLLLARGDARSRDTALRAALGAGRGRLARELLIENLVIVTMASGLGLLLAAGVLGAVRTVAPPDLRILESLRLDPWVTAAAVGCGLLTVLVFGTLPLAHRLRARPAEILGERAGTGTGDAVRLRRLLLVGEVALSFAMLVGAIQLVDTLGQAKERDPGMAVDELLAVTLRLPDWRFPDEASREATLTALRDRFVALPQVTAASLAGGPPTQTGIFFGAPEAEGVATADSEGGNAVFFGNSVSPGWFETVGQEVVQGRGFIAGDMASEPTPYVLGESAAARYFPEGGAVGGRFRLGEGEWHTVVGVVRDVWSTGSLNDPGYPQMYVLRGDGDGRALLLRTSDPASVAQAVRDVVRDVDLEIPVEAVTPVATLYGEALSREKLVALLLSVFAVTASLLSIVGLYGVASQLAVRRVREFGIRISLGAGRSSIFGLAVRGSTVAVAAGLGVGAGLTWAGMRLLEVGVAGLAGSDPVAFVAAGALLASATLVAMSGPGIRAARTDPVVALRSE